MNKDSINIIEQAWEKRELLSFKETQETIRDIIEKLDKGVIRVAEKNNEKWIVNNWIKKAIIMYFPIQKMETIEIGPLEFHDKMKLKSNYKKLGVRVVPHAIARYGAFLQKGVIMMLPPKILTGQYLYLQMEILWIIK